MAKEITPKKILYLTYFYEPDLSAGSFRNTTLIKALAEKLKHKGGSVDVIATMPNRSAVEAAPPRRETMGNINLTRIPLPPTTRGLKGEVLTYRKYFFGALREAKKQKYDLVVASSSKLFTAYLGSIIAKRQDCPLYLDVRDLFYENMSNVLKGLPRFFMLPLIKWVEKRTFKRADHINLITQGFQPNFKAYLQATYSFFTNGIDALFMDNQTSLTTENNSPKTIVYAGNIGYGQGLEKIIPQAAKKLGKAFHFIVIGRGGLKTELAAKIKELNLTNVELREPVQREELIAIYEKCDFTFVHLNDYEAFKKALPSKLFELACFPQPLIAGVGGFAHDFVKKNIKNKILFQPCDVKDLVTQLKAFPYQKIRRTEFIQNFSRKNINTQMAQSIIDTMH